MRTRHMLEIAVAIASFSVIGFGIVAHAKAQDLPVPDPAAVCDPTVSASIKDIQSILAGANDELVAVLPTDDPNITDALKSFDKTLTDVPPGITKIIGFLVDTPKGSDVYFAHPFDNNCVAGAGLPLLDYKPTAAKVPVPSKSDVNA